MAKWVSGYPPNKSGNYLIKTIVTLAGTALAATYTRLDYDVFTNEWRINGYRVANFGDGENFKKYWWDEYSSITETKIVKKLKF
jgi:hypothetical protein